MSEEVKNKAPAKGPMTVKLFEPIEHGSETITELVLKRPKAKHVKGLNLKDMRIADILQVASKLSGTSMSALDELSTEDMNRVVEAVGELL